MADKYIALLGGIEQEVEGTVTGGTPTQGGDIVALDGTGRLDPSIMPVGVVADTYAGEAHEALSAGAVVYIRPDGKVANASATAGGNAAKGFVLSSVTMGAQALVYFEGRNTALTALTPGTRYYLSDTVPGGITSMPVSGTGKLHQFIGTAITATSLNFEPDDYILRA